MSAIALFRSTNMAAMTSQGNNPCTLLFIAIGEEKGSFLSAANAV